MSSTIDLEKASEHSTAATTLSWDKLSYVVKNRDTPILREISGSISSGELMAVMGPSGSGKSSLLDLLCGRRKPSPGSGLIKLNGVAGFDPTKFISFVEQDDAVLGCLTVRETVAYAAYLALPRGTPGIEEHINATLKALGLQDVAHNQIGTPISRGISGGQKRRVTIACSMVARPRILVCDEPTSGLDAASGLEVVRSLRSLARETGTICIATIHQPNHSTFSLFDSLLLISSGEVMYNGAADELDAYLGSIGLPTPQHQSPADHAVNVINTEFYSHDTISTSEHISKLHDLWMQHGDRPAESGSTGGLLMDDGRVDSLRANLHKTRILLQRNFLNYRRNVLSFGIRRPSSLSPAVRLLTSIPVAMYAAMGFLLATVWINLGKSQTTGKIQDRLSVFFFSVAFLGFMSVSGIPSFLEERSVFIRERANGLYGPGIWVIANTLMVIPFLFVCTSVFALISYFAIGLHGGAAHFFKFLIYLFLGVFAAESQSMLIAAAIPIFVAALAIAAFVNGLWMVVQGYFIRATSLPRFWYYSAHFIDFQTFAFEILVKNDVQGLEFSCPVIAGVCSCPFASTVQTATNCAVSGDDLLLSLGYEGISEGLYVGILVIIIIIMRLAMWGVLVLRKR